MTCNVLGRNEQTTETAKKERGATASEWPPRPIFMGFCGQLERPFEGKRYKHLTPSDTAPGKPCNTRLFQPLKRNLGTSFPHALGGLPAGDPIPAIRAVFCPVGTGDEGCSTKDTPAHILPLVQLGI